VVHGRSLHPFVRVYIVILFTPGNFLDLAPTILFAAGVKFSILSEGEDLLKYPLEDQKYRFANSFLYDHFKSLKGIDYILPEKRRIFRLGISRTEVLL